MQFEKFSGVFLTVATCNNKASEVEEKQSILRGHLVPFFGQLELAEVSYALVQDYTAIKLRTLAEHTVKNQLAVLHRMLVVACKRRVLEHVPEFEWPRVPPPDVDFLNFDEAAHLVVGAADQWRRMILVALRTGLRLGELIALEPRDINLIAGTLEVRRSYTRGRVTAPKNHRTRIIPLSDDARDALAEQMAAHPGRLVFPAPGGGYLTHSMCRRRLESECRQARSRCVSWKIFRHTFASHLVMRGVPLKVVQELLGHSTMTMTLRYAHLAPEVSRDCVQLLDHSPSSIWPPPRPTSPRRLGARASVTRRSAPSGDINRALRPARACSWAPSSASR